MFVHSLEASEVPRIPENTVATYEIICIPEKLTGTTWLCVEFTVLPGIFLHFTTNQRITKELQLHF